MKLSRPVLCHGMTLVEILAVVIILGILASALTFGIAGKMGRARQEIARTQIAQILGQIEIMLLDNPRPGSPAGWLAELVRDPRSAWYLEPAHLNDPWGRGFIILAPGPDGKPFEIVSLGADGQRGGSGEDADITSANLERRP